MSVKSWFLELAVDASGEVALEQADCFAAGFAAADAFGDECRGVWIGAGEAECDGVEGAVEVAVAAAVEPVSVCLAAACGDRGDAGQAGEPGLMAESAGV